MPRTRNENGVDIPLTDEEEAARDAEEKAWSDAAPTRTFERLRGERNQKLIETDWWGASDQGEMSSDRASYRKALRDLPAQYDNSSVVGTITWPTKP